MARIERITGHYVCVTVDGLEYRVYYEEAGEGIPLLLQHTAGADGREYRHLLNDEEFTRDFRFIAYDLPYHGRSLPPVDYAWWESEYNLTLDFFLKFLDAFSDELGLERPAYLGCSMGGHLAPDLAYYRPERYRAVIGVEAGLKTSADMFDAGYSHMQAFRFKNDNPQVNRETIGAEMEMLCPTHIPAAARKEIGWVYNQSGPGVFAGDVYYYNFDHDLTGKANTIDVSKCMVYLLTGSYDPLTPPSTTRKLADEIKGCKFWEMEGLGHFAVTEEYERVRPYLLPILEEIRGLSISR
jgi:pimeloyl-ACP methyl ester carboxylesterase